MFIFQSLFYIMHQTGIIILAAGASSRLGEPKQLLKYQHNNFITHAINTALQLLAGSVVVVLGSRAAAIEATIAAAPVSIVVNKDWEEGMASSIRLGLTYLLQTDNAINKVILMVCDQPFVTTGLLQQLITTAEESSKAIVASSYSNTYGTPVLFKASFFPQLLLLQGPEGAKKIVMQHLTNVATVAFEKGNIDIDTPQDYASFQQKNV